MTIDFSDLADSDSDSTLEKAIEAAKAPGEHKYSTDGMEVDVDTAGAPSFDEFERDLVEISKHLASRPKRYIVLDHMTPDQLGFLQMVVEEMQNYEVELFDWEHYPRRRMAKVEFIGEVDSLVMTVKHADADEDIRGGMIEIIRRTLDEQAGEI